MGIQTTLENVVRTEDGPYPCYDAVVTAHDISQLYKTGFLKIDHDRQRGIDSITGKRILDDEKVDRWAEQLVKGEAYIWQVSWNFRKDETVLEYDYEKRSLKIGAGAATDAEVERKPQRAPLPQQLAELAQGGGLPIGGRLRQTQRRQQFLPQRLQREV